MSVTPEQVRAAVAGLPASVEGKHHGHPDFRVNNRLFATLSEREDRAAVRLPLLEARELAHTQPQVYRLVADRDPFSWLSVLLEQADPDELEKLLERAWSHIATL